MSKSPCVSVVIPAYRHQAFIAEAIDSVLRQSFNDLELIVIDDGSPDDTAAVAERALAHDPRARLLRQDNAGSHATINRGLSMARGEWVAILNSDDRYHPDRLERLLAVAGEAYDFLVSDLRLIDQDGGVVSDPGHWFNTMIEGFRQYARADGPVAGLLYGNYTASTSNFFFRRALLDRIGGLREYRYVVDWEFALRAALEAPERFTYLIDEPLFDYRLHGANTILSGALRGGAEIERMQRGILRERFGVPRALLAAMHRNHRHLRRHWRELGEQRVERFVRDREADVALLRDALDLESSTRQQEVALLKAKLAERETALAAHKAELAAIHASRSWRYTRILRKK
ncbi:glycosyltransferase [Marichromatium gracile]|uniref:glycosyltransferase n=1 Tax=Marichromatium gracile TaxID=1048 RepID=UPI001F307954|nr:glycosyltransferase [Marichromatium gracile]MCF1184875.1 glycosyltransferase [Marichromatium gracile]